MSCCRRASLPVPAKAVAGKLSGERIIPAPRPVETSGWHATAVTLRGSMLVVAVFVPTVAFATSFGPRELPVLALLLTAAHGSSLVYRRVRSR